MPGSKINLLSLDGGGVRGLSSLLILERLMKMIDRRDPPKPCEFFDMIAGTSTGGLIAIMLGRLHMSVRECIYQYGKLMDQVFSRLHSHRLKYNAKSISFEIQPIFDTRKLEAAIKDIVIEATGDVNELMMEEDPQCKVFVCVTDCQTTKTVRFPNYERQRGSDLLFESLKIWEAARATSAAPSFFDAITLGEYRQRFRDGGTGANNPIEHLWSEALNEWPDNMEDVNCLLSIGTGKPSAKEFQEETLRGLFDTLAAIATDTEETEANFANSTPDLTQPQSRRYFRLNVGEGLGNIGLEDTSKSKNIASVTNGLFEKQEEWQKALQIRDSLKSSRIRAVVNDESLDRKSVILPLRDAPRIPSRIESISLSSTTAVFETFPSQPVSEANLSATQIPGDSSGHNTRMASESQPEMTVTNEPTVCRSETVVLLSGDLAACRDQQDKMTRRLRHLNPDDRRQAQAVLFSEKLRLEDWVHAKLPSTRLIQGNKLMDTHSPMSFIWSVMINVLSTKPSFKVLSFACGIDTRENGEQGPLRLVRALVAQLLEMPTVNLGFTANFEKPYDGRDFTYTRRLLHGLLCECLDTEVVCLLDMLPSYENDTSQEELAATLRDLTRAARLRQERNAKPIKFLFTSAGPCETLTTAVNEEDRIYAAGIGSYAALLDRRVVEAKLTQMVEGRSDGGT